MKTHDIYIVKRIEKIIGKEIYIVNKINFDFNQCYCINEKNQVTALSLRNNILFKDDSILSLIRMLKNLITIDLSYNQIKDISFLEDIHGIQYLHLGYNQIEDISPILHLDNLRCVSLNYNKINNISLFCAGKFKTIEHVDLDNNLISKLPSCVIDFSIETVFSDNFEVGKINVGGNPLTHPPPEIIKQGREAMRAYFRSFEKDEAVTLHEAKVLLVGDGKAGKTSLLKRLQGLPFDEHESQTHGINVQPLLGSEIAGFANPDKDCLLHFWDFGGQEIMHASHRFFMSSRSLYILILDSRDDSCRCHSRWLQHIEKYGGQSPIIVAMNKMDANLSYNIEQNKINTQFPSIENRFIQISCKTGEHLPELVRSMAASVPKTPLYGLVISKAWLAIRKRLETATEEQNYISREQFLTICKEHGVDDEESRMTLLKLLNDLGTVLFFEKMKLADIYVLDPHWVTVGVYKIINSAKTKDGLLREEDLEFILNQEPVRCDEYDPAKKAFAYTVREQEYLVRIMEEFELCYRYDKHLHILPSQLPKEPEQEPELRGGNLLRFIME